jgi:hypothetical protein
MELASESARRKTWKAFPRSAGFIELKRCRIGTIFLALAVAQSKPAKAGGSVKNRWRRDSKRGGKTKVSRKMRALVPSKTHGGSVPHILHPTPYGSGGLRAYSAQTIAGNVHQNSMAKKLQISSQHKALILFGKFQLTAIWGE